jgi:WD40 repeat protein
MIATVFSGDGTTLWNAETGEQILILESEMGVRALDFSPQGDVVLTAGDSGARLWTCDPGLSFRQSMAAEAVCTWQSSILVASA